MLVSSIARLNVNNTLNISASKQNNSASNSAHTFGGEHELGMLNNIDKKLSLDLLTNKLLYKINYLQEKFTAKKHYDVSPKKSVNVLA